MYGRLRTNAPSFLLTFAVLWCGTAGIASASVHISEVAWMGSAENANAEWIELYNDGEAQSVEGWTLTAADGQPDIMLAGTLPSHGYALLERTSDVTVQGTTAFLVYTGALGNTGETLELRDEKGTTVDRVAGGENWELGGDNATKDTLQRAGEPATGGWITASPTPGRGGGTATAASVPSASEQSQQVEARRATTPQPVAVPPKVKLEPALTLDLGGDIVATVGSPVRIVARGHSETGRELVLENVVWAFGDGARGSGRTVTHTYEHEGEYRVVAVGARNGFRKEIEAKDAILVRVVRPTLTITAADPAYLEVHNTGEEELDLSGYFLVAGEDSYRLPEYTHLMPNAHVRFPSKVTGLTPREDIGVAIFSPDRALVVVYAREVAALPVATPVSVPDPTVAQRAVVRTVDSPAPKIVEPIAVPSAVSFSEPSTLPMPEIDRIAETYAALAKDGVAGTEGGNIMWWVAGLIAATFLAVVVSLLVRREQEEIVRGYAIESDE